MDITLESIERKSLIFHFLVLSINCQIRPSQTSIHMQTQRQTPNYYYNLQTKLTMEAMQ